MRAQISLVVARPGGEASKWLDFHHESPRIADLRELVSVPFRFCGLGVVLLYIVLLFTSFEFLHLFYFTEDCVPTYFDKLMVYRTLFSVLTCYIARC